MRRWFLAVLVLLVVLPGPVVMMTPWLLRSLIDEQVRDLGIDAVTIDRIDIDWINGRADMRGLALYERQEVVASVHTMAADWAWSSLASGELRQLALNGVYARLVHDNGSWGLEGLELPADSGEASGSPPAFALGRLDIGEARVSLDGIPIPQELRLTRLQLVDLDSRQRTPFSLDMALAQGELTADGLVRDWMSQLRIDAEARVSGLVLQQLAGLDQSLMDLHLKGRLSTRQALVWDGASLSSDGNVLLENTAFNVDALGAKAESLRWQGHVIADAKGEQISLDGVLDVQQLHAAGSGTTLWLDELNSETRGQIAERIELASDTRLKKLRLKMSSGLNSSAASLSWNGAVNLLRAKPGDLSLDGRLLGGRLLVSLPGHESISGDQLDWQGALQLADGAGKVTGDLSLASAAFKTREQNLALEDASWKGAIDLSNGAPSLLKTSFLRVASLRGELEEEQLSLKQGALEWSGDIDLSHKEKPGISGLLTLGPAQHRLAQVAMNYDSARFEGVRVAGLEDVRLNAIQIGGFVVHEPQNSEGSSFLNLQKLAIGPITRSSDRLRVDAVIIDGHRLRVLRDEEGRLRLPQATASPAGDAARARESAPDPTASPGSEMATETGLSWEIGAIELRGNNRWEFVDQQSGAGTLALEDIVMQMGAVSSQGVEATPMNFTARLGETGKLRLEGTFKPLADDPELDITATIRHLSMLQLSPYVEAAVAHRVTAGNLDADSQFRIEGGRLKASNALILHQFEVEASKAPEQKQGEPKTAKETEGDTEAPSVPLELGLALLRDSNNQIALELPVEGDLNDPQFDPSDVVGQAVGKAVTTGALLFLQPFGTLALAGKLALNQASLVQFEPAVFAAGETALTAEQRSYLDGLAVKLKERPGLRIKACGVANQADVVYLTPKPKKKPTDAQPAKPVVVPDGDLQSLGDTRAGKVRDYLKAQGVATGQLVSCAVRVVRDDTGKPRVELGM